MSFQNGISRRANVGDDRGGNLKLRTMLQAVTGENVDSPRTDGVGELHVRRVIADDERLREVDFVFALRDPQKIGFRLHAIACIRSLVGTAIDSSDRGPFLTQPLYHVIIDGARLFGADVPLGDSALVRHDNKDVIAEAAQR